VNASFYRGRLPIDSVRILTIYPGEFDEPIHCALQDYTFQNKPEYNAISYCWGAGQPTGEITVNGASSFGVSEHLGACLRWLRRTEHGYQVWIDALCTNQKDEEEKRQHMKRSRRVFLEAQRTVIWLGTTVTLRSVSSDEDTRTVPCYTPMDIHRVDQKTKDAVEAILAKGQHSTLSTRVWWKSFWCLHEFAVSATEPVVLLGPYFLEWASFSHFAGNALHPLFQYLNDTRETRAYVPCQMGLEDLRRCTSDTFRCTDDGDRGEALISILSLYKAGEQYL
jgi:hypothetical protein